MFKQETYIQRRNVLAEKVGSGIILLPGNQLSPMNYADNTYHFRQDSTFLYYFGLDIPSLVAIIDIENNTEVLFGNDFSIDDIVWMGAQPTIAELAWKCGVKTSRPLVDLSKFLIQAQQQGRNIHYLNPYRTENVLLLQNMLDISPGIIASKFSIDLTKAVVSQREIKSDEEITEIEKAVNLSVDMHVGAMQMARPGMTEAQIAARVYEIALAANCEVSFPIIATVNGQTLHNHYHGNVLKSGDLFLLDAGAETEMHYAGDLSSTFPVDKTFSSEQKQIYEMSLKAHQAAVDALGIGVKFKEVHFAACRCIAESMKSIGLLKGNTDEMLQQGVHALFMPCGTGHMMGLDVHDMENLGEVWVGYDGQPKSTQFGLKSLRLAKPLQPGHVFTIEPGIYFIPELIDKWKAEGQFRDYINWNEVEKFRHFGGIRNEEDFVITKEGARKLGKNKPKTIKEIEEVRSN